MALCRCLDGHVKEPYEMSMTLEPDHRPDFHLSPPAQLCAITYMTEISLHVTLIKQQCSRTLVQSILDFGTSNLGYLLNVIERKGTKTRIEHVGEPYNEVCLSP